MRNKKKSGILPVIFIIVLFGQLTKAQQLHEWEIYELSFRSDNEYVNPYNAIPVDAVNEDLLTVTFSGVNGAAEGEEIKVTGYWDGEKNWKVRFAPPETGTWRYESSSKDKAMDGKKGKLTVKRWSDAEKEANLTRRGFLSVNSQGPRSGHYFQYQDGTPFLWMGDTWWNWTQRGILFSSWKNLVDDVYCKSWLAGTIGCCSWLVAVGRYWSLGS